MSPHTTWLIIYLGATTLAAIKIPICKCPKRQPLLLIFTHHPPLLYMAFNLFMCICTVVLYIAIDVGWWAAGVWVGWSLFECARIWYHEKDKIKKAMKALGSVRINEHGRLVVTHG